MVPTLTVVTALPSQFPRMTDCVSIKYNSEAGRHGVATNKINPGDYSVHVYCTWNTQYILLYMAYCMWRIVHGYCIRRTAPAILHIAYCEWRTAHGIVYKLYVV